MATSATVNINEHDFTLQQGSYQKVFYDGEKWVGLYPIVGDVKIQYAGQPTPQELYLATEWEDISEQYAGLFFRAKGGDALPFGQTQEESLPNITGEISSTIFKYDGSKWGLIDLQSGAFLAEDEYPLMVNEAGLSRYSGFSKIKLDASHSSPIYKDGAHVTPKNQAVTMWRRKG